MVFIRSLERNSIAKCVPRFILYENLGSPNANKDRRVSEISSNRVITINFHEKKTTKVSDIQVPLYYDFLSYS